MTLARTGVEYDYRGDVIDAHAPEMPTRFAKQLAQVVRGAVAIGIDRTDAMRLAIRCARDSMPPLRLAALDDIAQHPMSTPAEVRKRLGKPRATVDRQLQALNILGVLQLFEEEGTASPLSDERKRIKWRYALADGISPDVLVPEKLVDTSCLSEESETEGTNNRDSPQPGTNISGINPGDTDGQQATCSVCGQEMFALASIERGHCERCALTAKRHDGATTDRAAS